MEVSNFVHLHVHSEYSLLDGAARIKDLVQSAQGMGMEALALTDHGVMYGALEFYMACVKAGIKPIIGCEIYTTRGETPRYDRSPPLDDEGNRDPNERGCHHLVLLAKNFEGYQNLTRIVSSAHLEGFYYKPRADKELLRTYSKGIIASSACLAGEVASHVLRDRYERAREAAQAYRDIFGEGNFYLEVQSNGMKEQDRVNAACREMGNELGIPLCASADVHYLKPKDAVTQDLLICIGTRKLRDDPQRFGIHSKELYLKDGEQMARQLESFDDAIRNTVDIARHCNLEVRLDPTKVIMPAFDLPPEENDHEVYLRRLVDEGAVDRYGEITPPIRERIETEMEVIVGQKFTTYFLIVWDFIRYAREQEIPVGPGRGSAAGSVVAYSLQITDIDPLEHGLLFERFLNPERISPPDIDIDFSDLRRDEVIRYVQEKYGSGRVAQIATFGTIKAKNAIRDVGRVLGLPAQECDRIAKLIPDTLGIKLEDAVKQTPELQAEQRRGGVHTEMFEHALNVEGMSRQVSTHAAGVIIAPRDLTDYTPLMRGANKESDVSTQYSMKSLEQLGLLKMDFLGLKNLSIMDRTVNLVLETRGEKIDLTQLPLVDEATFELLSRAKTNGVFQLESMGMKDILKKLGPNQFSDLVAILALYRPGPIGAGMVDEFINRKHGRVEITYDHPSLEPILKDTYGIILYQEQVMRIGQEIAGFSLGEADIMRRAMGKKNEEMLQKHSKLFLEGSEKRGVSRQIAEKLWNLIFHFAGYGFNKSHSAAYALITYRTAWLKAHYPKEYLTSLMTADMGDTNKIVKYMSDCKEMGIHILPPDINQSGENFTPSSAGIRFGLAATKGVGHGAVRSVLEQRDGKGEFRSLQDFCDRAEPNTLNRGTMEALIRSGSFDSLGHTRRTLLANFEDCLEKSHGRIRDKRVGQFSLFGDAEDDEATATDTFEELPEMGADEILGDEKGLLGIYLTGHPLADVAEELEMFANATAESLQEDDVRLDNLRVAGIITEVKKRNTRTGSRMAICQIEDLTGVVEVAIMGNLLEQRNDIIVEGQVVVVEGTGSQRGDSVSIRADRISPLNDAWTHLVDTVHVDLIATGLSDAQLEGLKSVVQHFPGGAKLYIHLKVEGLGDVIIEGGPSIRVAPCRELKSSIEEFFEENIVRFNCMKDGRAA